MGSFNAGLSALSASQLGLDIIGQNIANANTPGYHRQVADLTESPPMQLGSLDIGTGVQVQDIQRLQSTFLDQAITAQTSDAGSTTSQLNTLQQVETLLTPGAGSLDTLLGSFFNQLQQLASQPGDAAQRQVVLGDATSLTNAFNSLANNFAQIAQSANAQVTQAVQQVNSLAGQIAQLNGQIQNASAAGTSANDLLDQRDQLINQVAAQVGVQTVPQPDGQTSVLVGGVPLVLGSTTTALQVSTDPSGNVAIEAAGSQQPLSISGGALGGYLPVLNQTLPNYQQSLNTLAQTFARSIDEVQATGLGVSGPMTSVSGTRAVSSTSVPLAQANLAFPPQAGSLYITVTDQATGQQTLSQVAIDPATQSLQDVANAISGVSHIQAVTDPQTGTLTILAQPGFAFDFAGQLPPSPDVTGFTGTSVPQIGGAYTGAKNDTYTFQVVGSGTVGVTPNLGLQVTNAAGNVVANLNIGQGYEPGSTLQVADGVTVALSSGTASSGQFVTPVVSQPDTAGLLSALGLNTFFTGSNAGDLAVQPGLLNNAQGLAASTTGQPGDNSNLQKMLALQNNPLLGNGTQTFLQFYAGMVGDIGTQVQGLTQQQTTQAALAQQLQTQQQSVSGVDTNEEMVNLLQFQQAFQSAARYIDEVNNTLNYLFTIFE